MNASRKVERTNTIFLVDDDLPMRTWFEAIFTEPRYAVTTFESGEAALAAISNLPCPQLLIVDFSLGSKSGTMNGEQFINALQLLNPNFRDTTEVIGFSNYGTTSLAIASFKNVVDTYFEKPSDVEEAIALVDQLLNHPSKVDVSHLTLQKLPPEKSLLN